MALFGILSEMDRHRLMVLAEHGYGHSSPKIDLLHDLGYLRCVGNVYVPTERGWEAALAHAEALWRDQVEWGLDEVGARDAGRTVRVISRNWKQLGGEK